MKPVQSLSNIESYKPPLDGRRSYQGLLLDFNEKIAPSDNEDTLYPEYEVLQSEISKYCGVDTESVLVAAGSGSAISLLFRAYCNPGDLVTIPQPSFSLLFQAAKIAEAEIVSPQYDNLTGEFPYDEVSKLVSDAKICVICNPNNPTGTSVSAKQIKRLAQKSKKTMILVDEAYVEYSGESAVELIREYPNIVVIRTFSKAFGLAALRVGYVVADPGVIQELKKICSPYEVAMPSAVAAVNVLKELSTLKQYISEEVNKSKDLIEEFFTEYGIPFYLTSANFICFRPEKPNEVYDALKSKQILIRKVANDTMLRVTLGTIESAKAFIDAYQSICTVTEKAAFLDRDGTMIFEPQDTYQIDKTSQISLLDGVKDGLKRLKAAGYSLVMITNQDGLGTKGYPRENFLAVQNSLLMELALEGIWFSRVLVCPHFPEDDCMCRKPKLGLVDDSITRKIDRKKSFVIGDRESDVEFGDNLRIMPKQMSVNGSLGEAIGKILMIVDKE